MNKPTSPFSSNRSRGQALLEFALVLPLLLLIFFIIIEFGLLFQAWLVVENTARSAARYAVTGQYDEAYCPIVDGVPECETQEDVDTARTPSIRQVGYDAAAGIMRDGFPAAILRNNRSFFRVVVCGAGSTENIGWDETGQETGAGYPQCVNFDTNQEAEYPGAPGSRVLIYVEFDHPLVTPLRAVAQWVPLIARREMIVERFRAVRIAGVPPTVVVPSPTPSNTPTPSLTPTPSNTASPTPTLTPSNTPTPSLTPTPSCSALQPNNDEQLFRTGDDWRIPLTNVNGSYSVNLTSASVSFNGGWHDQVTSRPTVTFDQYRWNGSTFLNPANVTLNGAGGFNHSFSQSIAPNGGGNFDVDFTDNLPQYLHGHDWSVTINYTVGGLACSLNVIGRYGPEVTAVMPANPVTGAFAISANASDPDPGGSVGRVQFVILNSAGTVVHDWTENGAPWCFRGDNGSACTTLRPWTDRWSNGALVTNGTYTVRIEARDNDPHQQYTRIQTTLVINAATPTPSNTPRPTRTPTRTNTPRPTRTPGPTSTLGTPPTPTRTNTPGTPPPSTSTKTRTPSPTPPSGASPTPSRTPTKTPTPSRTPTIDFGG